VLADPVLPAHRPQPHAQQHGLHHRGAIGFPNASGTIPPENGMLTRILGEQGWNT
jgi:arylsulfatase A-like enzyme